jgi:hypothetical protein
MRIQSIGAERGRMSELVLRFEHLVGRAALKAWSDLPRELQERVFEDAVGGDTALRHKLAVYLHDHHPRTAHPPKPTARLTD